MFDVFHRTWNTGPHSKGSEAWKPEGANLQQATGEPGETTAMQRTAQSFGWIARDATPFRARLGCFCWGRGVILGGSNDTGECSPSPALA
eukprot:2964669-Rhodomonas_salina.2